jgi:hypothetical protein
MSSVTTTTPARDYADPQKNARRYRDPAGDRINLSYIIAHKGISAHVFRVLLVKAAERGEPLVSNPEKIRPSSPFTEMTWRETAVDALIGRPLYPVTVKDGVWRDETTFQHQNGTTCRTVKGSVEKGIHRKIAERAINTPCRYLRHKHGTPRRIKSYLVEPQTPRNRDRVRVFAENDLDEIATGLRRPLKTVVVEGKRLSVPGDPLWVDELGEWYSETKLCATFGKSRGFVQYYARRKSKLRPKGKALRKKLIPYPYAGPAGNSIKRWALLLTDLVGILQGKEGKRIGAGRGGDDTERLRQEEKSKAGRALKAILGGGPLPPSEVLAKAAELGVTEYRAREAFNLYCERISGRFGQKHLWRLKPGVVVEKERVAPADGARSPGPKKRRGERGAGKKTAKKHQSIIDAARTGNYHSLQEVAESFLPKIISKSLVGYVLQRAGIVLPKPDKQTDD